MSKSPQDALETMIRNLKEKTGKPIEEWVAIARASGAAKHGQLVSLLKAQHGVTHGYANLIAQSALSPAPSGEEDLVAAQYSGSKAGLRPIYEAVVDQVKAFGPDVEISPKKTCVSLRRNKQFALVQPTTATRVDVGINLKGTPPAGRLEASGSFNAMVSHRVRVASPREVDGELMGWLRQAYEAS